MSAINCRLLTSGVALCLLMTLLPVSGKEAQEKPSTRLVRQLSATSKINFYFLNRTEEYDYSVADFIRASSIQVGRGCGNNCANFMRDVVDHFEKAKPAKCLKGQQNVVIAARGGPVIVYSYSGRHITYEGKCYSNPQPVNKVVQRSEFIF
jgi:hypothetical protein